MYIIYITVENFEGYVIGGNDLASEDKKEFLETFRPAATLHLGYALIILRCSSESIGIVNRGGNRIGETVHAGPETIIFSNVPRGLSCRRVIRGDTLAPLFAHPISILHIIPSTEEEGGDRATNSTMIIINAKRISAKTLDTAR